MVKHAFMVVCLVLIIITERSIILAMELPPKATGTENKENTTHQVQIKKEEIQYWEEAPIFQNVFPYEYGGDPFNVLLPLDALLEPQPEKPLFLQERAIKAMEAWVDTSLKCISTNTTLLLEPLCFPNPFQVKLILDHLIVDHKGRLKGNRSESAGFLEFLDAKALTLNIYSLKGIEKIIKNLSALTSLKKLILIIKNNEVIADDQFAEVLHSIGGIKNFSSFQLIQVELDCLSSSERDLLLQRIELS